MINRDSLIAKAPDALLVVAQIIPLGYGHNKGIQDYNNRIPSLIQHARRPGSTSCS